MYNLSRAFSFLRYMKWWLVTIFLIVLAGTGCGQQPKELNDMEFPVQKSEEEWRSMLTEEQYRVLRNKGTERPYSGELYYLNDEGIYTCAACQAPLFTSETKFDAHCGWPSFYVFWARNRMQNKNLNTFNLRHKLAIFEHFDCSSI